VSVAFAVNGRPVRVGADADTPLLHALRQDLGLTGAKLGCGAGSCGACTVHLDGRAVQSCTTPLWSVEGRAVTTVEGLGADGAPDPVLRAFADERAAQCGYCIPGIVMTVRALLGRRPLPDDDAVRRELAERHLCRCGTHVRILRAAARARAMVAEATP